MDNGLCGPTNSGWTANPLGRCGREATIPGRRKDLGDVQELIRLLKLPADFSEQLHPSVRTAYHELWAEVQAAPPPQ